MFQQDLKMIPKLNHEVVSQITEMLNAMPLPAYVDDVDLDRQCIESDWFKAGWHTAIQLAVVGLQLKSKPGDTEKPFSMN